MTEQVQTKRDWDLPGDGAWWLFLTAEFLTLWMFFFVFAYMRKNNLEEFQAAQALLDPRYALANSLVLITSGYAVARAARAMAAKAHATGVKWLAAGALLGLVFVVIKSTEYSHKLELGLTLSSGHFWFFYYFLTGFHFLHVLLGIGFITWVATRLQFEPTRPGLATNLDSCAAFWHMLDLVWIIMFPLLYLL